MCLEVSAHRVVKPHRLSEIYTRGNRITLRGRGGASARERNIVDDIASLSIDKADKS